MGRGERANLMANQCWGPCCPLSAGGQGEVGRGLKVGDSAVTCPKL